jgi:Ca2+-binding EF-hand superfamily protein
VLKRERAGAQDHQQEAAFRRENYEGFRRNLEEAFDEYNANNDAYLSK